LDGQGSIAQPDSGMTPEQIKTYIDALFHTRDTITWVSFIGMPIISAVVVFFVAYFTDKGKNRATKEDIGEITAKVEAVKTQYSEDLEKVRAELAAKGHYNKVRYERELKAFEELWPKLHDLNVAVLSLRPIFDTAIGPNETEESRKKQRATQFGEAHIELNRFIERSRPFYPESVWTELRKLLGLSWSEAVDYRFLDPKRNFDEYWKKAEANSKAIDDQTIVICEAIRKRLAEFD
jgi:hypothetical protein